MQIVLRGLALIASLGVLGFLSLPAEIHWEIENVKERDGQDLSDSEARKRCLDALLVRICQEVGINVDAISVRDSRLELRNNKACILLALTFRRAQLDLQLASRFIRGMFKQREALYTFSEEGPFDWRPRPGPLADGWKAISVMYFKKWKDEIAASHVSSLSGNLARTTPRQDLSLLYRTLRRMFWIERNEMRGLDVLLDPSPDPNQRLLHSGSPYETKEMIDKLLQDGRLRLHFPIDQELDETINLVARANFATMTEAELLRFCMEFSPYCLQFCAQEAFFRGLEFELTNAKSEADRLYYIHLSCAILCGAAAYFVPAAANLRPAIQRVIASLSAGLAGVEARNANAAAQLSKSLKELIKTLGPALDEMHRFTEECRHLWESYLTDETVESGHRSADNAVADRTLERLREYHASIRTVRDQFPQANPAPAGY